MSEVSTCVHVGDVVGVLLVHVVHDDAQPLAQHRVLGPPVGGARHQQPGPGEALTNQRSAGSAILH